MRELSLHLLDIAENSVAAGSKTIILAVEENHQQDRLRIVVIDDGKGMDEATAKHVLDPFFTSRTTRKVGLGLPLLKEAAEACNGSLTLTTAPGKGTRVEVEFQNSHIDRMPLGDLATTYLNLFIAYPQVHWIMRYAVNDRIFELDDQELKTELTGIPLTDPDILAFLRRMFAEGINEVRGAN